MLFYVICAYFGFELDFEFPFSHNHQITTFKHPVTGQFSPENLEFILQEE